MKTILTISFLFLTITLFAQDPYSVTKNDNKRVFGDTLIVFYGETIYVEATVVDNKITEFKKVDQVTDASKTIVITLGEGALGGNNSADMKISNPFDKTITYKAEMKTPKKMKEFIETSVVPIYPKIYSLEMWPYKIEVIMLTKIQLK